jgi:hypothetical protein
MKPMGKAAEALLIITGSMGSGKTTIVAEASDILVSRDIAHAAIDLDALGTAYFSLELHGNGLVYRNLKSVWQNYAALGTTRLLLAAALEDCTALECCCAAVSCVRLVVCRLRASSSTMQQRVRVREPGMLQQRFVDRVKELDAILDRAKLEDFAIDNEDRSVTEVAREMLTRAGWLSGEVAAEGLRRER